MKFLHLSLILCLLSCPVFSAPEKIDSLESVLVGTLSEKERLVVLVSLASEYVFKDALICKKYSKEGLHLARANQDTVSEKNLIASVGIAEAITGFPDSATFYFKRKLYFDSIAKDSSSIGASYSSLGNVQMQTGNFQLALFYHQRGLEIFEAIGDSAKICKAYSNLGTLSKSIGDYKTAISYYFIALNEEEKRDDKRAMANSYMNIANIMADQGDYEHAFEFYKKSMLIHLASGNKYNLAWTYGNIASVFYDMQELDSAARYYNKELVISEEIGDQAGVASTLSNLGSIEYRKGGNKGRAMELLQRGLKIRKAIHARDEEAKSLNEIAQLYLWEENYKMAIRYLDQSESILKEFPVRGLLKNMMELKYQSHKGLGQTIQALHYHEQWILLKDSILSEEAQNQMLNLELKYASEKNALEIENLNHENELARSEIEKQNAIVKQGELEKLLFGTGFLVALVLMVIAYRGYRSKERSNQVISKQKAEVEQQKDLVEEKNKEIVDSINYAKRIQSAILPSVKNFERMLTNSFVLYLPKDIVSGDFYWIAEVEEIIYIAVVDCTGHGVPGAMVSVVGHNGLNRCVKEFNLRKPADILDKLTELVEATFENDENDENEVKDGMDIALCAISKTSNELQFAGANNPLWLVSRRIEMSELPGIKVFGTEDGLTLFEMKADKQPIGKYEDRKPFTNNVVRLAEGDHIYMFSDGFADQFGGPKGKKFKYKPFKQLILEMNAASAESQRKLLKERFIAWQGELEQIDDVCVVGIRI